MAPLSEQQRWRQRGLFVSEDMARVTTIGVLSRGAAMTGIVLTPTGKVPSYNDSVLPLNPHGSRGAACGG
jgi:hypothetical protein